MERKGDDTKRNDAQILAQLRRRPASTNRPQAEENAFWFDEPSVAVPQTPPVSLPPATANDESADVASRSEALRRLVAGSAPKEPMSALSPTLRNLREELDASNAATFAVEFNDNDDFADDATLDLLESTLDASQRREENDGKDGANAATSELAQETEFGQSEAETFELNNLNDRNGETSPSELAKSLDAAESAEILEPSTPLLASEDAPPEATEPSTSRIILLESAESDGDPRKERDDTAVVAPDLMVVSNLKKGYVKAKKLIPVLQGVDLTARQGELLAIVGQSGSGKSTLLHLMGTLDAPDSGTIHFDGQRIDNLSASQRDVLRNRFIGMIFQFYHLIPEMTTLENVLAPLMIRESFWGYWSKKREYVARAKELLALVGLSHRLNHRPNELSGGEMQRASIARALISNPRILLADEPTGNLDSKASVGVLKLLRQLNEEQNLTIVMVTHDMSQAADADRAIRLVDGLVVPE